MSGKVEEVTSVSFLVFFYVYITTQDLAGGSAWLGAVRLSISCRQSSNTLPVSNGIQHQQNEARIDVGTY